MKLSFLPIALSAALLGGLAPLHALAEEGHEGHSRLRVHFSKSSETDLVTVVVGDFERSPENNYLVGATWGHDLSDTLFGLPIPMTWHVGVQWFNERGYQQDGYGATTFVKANHRMRVPWTQKHIDLGLGEGLSYVSRIPMSEERDFEKKGEGIHSEKLMNYLEWTIDLPLRQFDALEPLFRSGGIEDMSVGFIVWHRSSIFGVFAETKGGVNFMGFGFEAKF
jgi:outer membrane protein